MTEHELREALGDTAVEAARAVADTAPALTPALRDQLAVLLRTISTTKAPERAA